MAIYKLNEIYEITSGLSKGAEYFGSGTPILSFKDIFNNANTPRTYSNYVEVTDSEKERFSVLYGDVFLTRTSETIDELGMSSVCLNNDNVAVFNGFSKRLRPNELGKRICLPHYMQYAFRTTNFRRLISSYTTLSTRASLNEGIINHLYLDIPSIDEQQKIIDIIKPIEACIMLLTSIGENIEKLENSLIYNSVKTNITFDYNKGGLAGDDGTTTFLNVASANGNPNRYVSNEPNIFIGDITLSLDGNCGLVNNCLEGYNGYLYKVTAKNIPNWQVFYSLKTNDSKCIIKLNETGTTIKHASGAKKELVVHEFDNPKLLKSLFLSKIKIVKMKTDLEKKVQNTLKLLIK